MLSNMDKIVPTTSYRKLLSANEEPQLDRSSIPFIFKRWKKDLLKQVRNQRIYIRGLGDLLMQVKIPSETTTYTYETPSEMLKKILSKVHGLE